MSEPTSDPDAELVKSTLSGRVTLCTDCIARRIRIGTFRVEDAAQRLSATRVVISEVGRCETCRVRALVHRLGA